MKSARTVVVALYHDEPPVTLAADLRTEELVVHLGAKPVVLELNGFTATWGLLTPVGHGTFEVRDRGWTASVTTFAPTGGDIRVTHAIDQN